MLRDRLGLESVSLPTDPAKANRDAASDDRRLDPDAREAIERWYAADYKLIALCDELFPSASDQTATLTPTRADPPPPAPPRP